MQEYPYPLRTKLPNIGISIFAVMSQLANEHNAINLSQGFPDFEISPKLIELVNKYMKKGYNQYASMPGVPILRKRIAEKYKKSYGAEYDPDSEINITAGATQAINTVISAFVKEGDEVIVFDPAYDSYVPSVKLNGGIVRYAKLRMPDYHAEWNDVKKLMNSHTRMIIINSPHNPTGSIFSEDDLKALDKLTRNTEIIVLSDEVYEHLIFDGKSHESVCKYPELARRSFLVGSFGKTFHATGWKVGYCMAPENLMAEFLRSHQFVVYAVNTPIQYAIAEFLENEENYNNLASFYQQKRDLFLDLIKPSRFREIPSHGTYFQVLNYENISNENEVEFAVRMTKEFGVASIPLSVFYNDKQDNKTLRFCFAKKEETLKKAAEILCRI